MRTIKFRAWITEAKQMIEHNVIDFNDFLHKTNLDGSINPSYCGDDDILMQFTGLYDKNGKEIYEGDIVKYYIEKYLLKYYVTTVNWGNKAHGFKLKCDTRKYEKFGSIKYFSLPSKKFIEIIGNIYENPELLK